MPNLLNFDQVFTISQQTINTQFYLMYLNGTIKKEVAWTNPKNEKVGFHLKLDKPEVNINLRDKRVNPQAVTFKLKIKSGKADFFDQVGDPQSIDLSNWQIMIEVSLSSLPITPEYQGIRMEDATKSKLQEYLGQEMYTTTAILMDFSNLNYGTAQILNAEGKQDSAISTLLALIFQKLVEGGNPYILSISVKDNKRKDTGLDGFKPTSVLYNTHLYNDTNADSKLSTYNMCIMNQMHQQPYTIETLPKFTSNLIDKEDVYARLFISKAQFNSVYIEGCVLPVLKQAMGNQAEFMSKEQLLNNMPTKYRETMRTKLPDNHWSYTHNYIDEGDHGYERFKDSGVVGVFGKEEEENHCSLSYEANSSTENSIVIKGEGSFYKKIHYWFDLKLKWYEASWASVKLPFSFTITIEAGEDGKLTIAFVHSKGDIEKDDWRNTPTILTDTITNLINKAAALLHESRSKPENPYPV